MYLAYTYIIRNKITDQFYYGSRYHNVRKNRTPEEDLWIYYFTTSKYVKDDIDIFGKESFDASIIFTDQDYDMCYWYEQMLIKEHINNPLCMNKHYVDKDAGHHKFSSIGLVHTDCSKRKMSLAKTGKPLPRTESTTQKIVATRKKNGVRPSKEAKLKQSNSMMGKIPWNKGKAATSEAKNNQSASLIGKPWSQARRDAHKKKLIPLDIEIVL